MLTLYDLQHARQLNDSAAEELIYAVIKLTKPPTLSTSPYFMDVSKAIKSDQSVFYSSAFVNTPKVYIFDSYKKVAFEAAGNKISDFIRRKKSLDREVYYVIEPKFDWIIQQTDHYFTTEVKNGFYTFKLTPQFTLDFEPSWTTYPINLGNAEPLIGTDRQNFLLAVGKRFGFSKNYEGVWQAWLKAKRTRCIKKERTEVRYLLDRTEYHSGYLMIDGANKCIFKMNDHILNNSLNILIRSNFRDVYFINDQITEAIALIGYDNYASELATLVFSAP